jgi:hypothetical protein
LANEVVALRPRESERLGCFLHAPCPTPGGTDVCGAVPGTLYRAVLCMHVWVLGPFQEGFRWRKYP